MKSSKSQNGRINLLPKTNAVIKPWFFNPMLIESKEQTKTAKRSLFVSD